MVWISFIKTNNNKLYISKSVEKLMLKANNKVTIQFGHWKHQTFIEVDDQLPENTIAMPNYWFKGYNIPTELPYEIVVKKNTILIGPVIAFIFRRWKSNLTLEALEKCKNRFKGYENINGLIYVCAGDGINLDDQTVEGYAYNPYGSNKNERWKYGVFPLPGAIFKRRSIPRNIQTRLEKVIGRKVFNSFAFNKWQLYKSVTGYEVKKYFPQTKRLTSSKVLQKMLEAFPVVYLKPRGSFKGKGIYRVQKQGQQIIFTTRNQEKVVYDSIDSAEAVLERFIASKHYLIQQGIEVNYKENHHVDFRLFLQKNSKKEWVCQGFVGRFGKKKSIITNSKFLDFLMQGREALKELFTISEKAAMNIEAEMIQVGIDTCKVMDLEIGHYGDVAIDMIVDQHQNIWVLEVNNHFYGYRKHLEVESMEAIQRIRQTPFEYAKTLCGFSMKN